MDNEEEPINDELPPMEDKKPLVRKNPNSGMSVRGAKRIWFAPRKSGRPNKEYSDKLQEARSVLLSAGESLKRALIRKSNIKPADPKRPRGRPKKAITGIVKEKRPRGRPRKNPVSVDKPKRPRGRPRKHPEVTDKIQRPRGRPRKNPTEDTPVEERKKKA